jgi:hypothetical protein
MHVDLFLVKRDNPLLTGCCHSQPPERSAAFGMLRLAAVIIASGRVAQRSERTLHKVIVVSNELQRVV